VSLIERLRNSCEDGINPEDIYEAADMIEQLEAELEAAKDEVERLNNNFIG
jgi:hypothetical protein